MSTFTHSSDRPVNYAAVWRRPPHHARRTATTVLAGNYGWFDCEDLLALHTDKATPDSSAVSESSAPQSAVQPPVTSQPILQETNHERRTSSAGATATTSTAKGGRGKAKAKAAPSVTRPVDMGVSIIPICSPGTGTPRPSPEPPSPPPHPHRRPPHSFASTSSASGRPDFDAGAQRAVEDTPAGATVGKRSRRPSQSQRPRLPISPPVTSPNTSTSELPPLTGVSELDDIASRLTITTAGTKRTRNGREIVRRKRRKTETRGEAPPVAVKKEEHVEFAQFENRRRALFTPLPLIGALLALLRVTMLFVCAYTDDTPVSGITVAHVGFVTACASKKADKGIGSVDLYANLIHAIYKNLASPLFSGFFYGRLISCGLQVTIPTGRAVKINDCGWPTLALHNSIDFA
ncbi:hypothetical protein RhiJN_14886 [Ceratobasidium sp. AG-Ba]|nr:hypothetical protein RhiJN_14886 [Ceratobasidium sp. AG-Ba]